MSELHKPDQTTFIFRVEDEQGVWGDVKESAPNQEEAERRVREYLDNNHTGTRGSLLDNYTLALITQPEDHLIRAAQEAMELAHMQQKGYTMHTELGHALAEAIGLKKNKDGNYETENGVKRPAGLYRMVAEFVHAQDTNALVVQEGETGDGPVIRVIITEDIPNDIDELAAYGCQHVQSVGIDHCETADDVRAIFNEMNPPDPEED